MEEKEREEKEEIWSWGAGTDGQLATTKLHDQLSPQLLSLSLSFSLLSCGGAHVLALTPCGKVMSWGRGESGQLGHDGHNNNNKCLYPKFVHTLDGFVISHISAGWNHSGFVSDSGRLFTCGDGSFGQLGHGDYRSYSTPKEVSFFSSKHVRQIACGMRHSLVLLKGSSGDQIYGFGAGKRGQLGVSKDKIKSSSLPQPCSVFEGSKVVSIIANGDHSASLTDDGRLYTWGRGFSRSPDVSVPLALPSSLNVKHVALGWNHALVLTDEQEVYMLGGSHHGMLSEPEKMIHAHSSSSDLGQPSLSKVPGLDGKQIVQIAAGAEHSAVATENGEIWTWGWGEHGQLGLGDTTDYVSPQLVNLGHNFSDDNNVITRVYCGSGFTFALKTQSSKHMILDDHHE